MSTTSSLSCHLWFEWPQMKCPNISKFGTFQIWCGQPGGLLLLSWRRWWCRRDLVNTAEGRPGPSSRLLSHIFHHRRQPSEVSRVYTSGFYMHLLHCVEIFYWLPWLIRTKVSCKKLQCNVENACGNWMHKRACNDVINKQSSFKTKRGSGLILKMSS